MPFQVAQLKRSDVRRIAPFVPEQCIQVSYESQIEKDGPCRLPGKFQCRGAELFLTLVHRLIHTAQSFAVHSLGNASKAVFAEGP